MFDVETLDGIIKSVKEAHELFKGRNLFRSYEIVEEIYFMYSQFYYKSRHVEERKEIKKILDQLNYITTHILYENKIKDVNQRFDSTLNLLKSYKQEEQEQEKKVLI